MQERLDARNFPSLFAAWDGCVDLPQNLSWEERDARHDLMWGRDLPGQQFEKINGKIVMTWDIEGAKEKFSEYRRYNPNMIFLFPIPFSVAPRPESFLYGKIFTDGFPFVRHPSDDEILTGSGDDERSQVRLIDFTHPDAQETIVQLAKAVDDCEYFDGIFFDWWNETGDALHGHKTQQEEQEAQTQILQSIRDRVSDDFLIVVNTNDRKAPNAAPYINGLFMETFRQFMPDDFQHLSMMRFEEVLLWSAAELRYPQITCFEAEGIGLQSPMSRENLQNMRCLTALYLTHSDGFFLYTMGVQGSEAEQQHVHDSYFRKDPEHEGWHAQGDFHLHHHSHYCHNFWDVDLGRPIGEKAQLYEDREGLFIREFTNGWAVYNRSGNPQEITFLEQVKGWHSGIAGIEQTLTDLDGEIYLKSVSRLETPPTVDVNGDGVVNVLDLVVIANAFGKQQPDINGDGVVNILDLVKVAKAM